MFKAFEFMFRSFELTFKGFELKFRSFEHSLQLGINSFSPRFGKKQKKQK